MSDAPSWVQHMDGRQRPRSLSVQPENFWDTKKSPYQPLKWQTEYNQRPSPSASPRNSMSGPSPRTSIPHSGSRASLLSKHNSANLDPIPEDNFLDRGTDFRFVGGIRNPVFEMNDMAPQAKNQRRRFSEGDVLDTNYDRSYNRSENAQFRNPNTGNNSYLSVEDNRKDRRRGSNVRDLRSDMRSETRSDVSVGGRSVQSGRGGRSESVISDKSDETKLTSATSTRSGRRQSESGSRSNDRRSSVAASRRGSESTRSSSVTTVTKTDANILTASPIEIPIEFLETPATRIKKLFGPVIMCVLVITLAASLGAAIYFATVLKDAQEETIQLLKAQLELSTSGVNVQSLSQRQIQTLTTNYCEEMDELYKQSAKFEKTYKNCEVDHLSDGKITFTLYFTDQEEQERDIEDNIVEVLKGKATKGSNSKQIEIDDLKLDLDTVKVTLEKVKVETTISTTSTTAPTTPSPPVQHSTKTTSQTTHTTRTESAHTTLTTRATTGSTTQDTKTTAAALTTSTQDPCEGLSGEYLPHHRECNLYIQCHNGVSITFVCAQGTVFDIKEKVCNVKTDDIVCPEKPPIGGYDWSARDPWDPCRTGSGEQFFPYPEDCNLFFQCEYKKSIVRLCPNDAVFDIDQQTCVSKTPDFVCNTITTPSAPPQADTNLQKTVTGIKVTGSTTPLPPIIYPSRPVYDPQPCKEGKNGGLYPHPTDCSKYILCEFTNEVVRPCANGLFFHPKIKTCVPPKNDLQCPDILPCEGRNDDFLPHPTSCNQFIMCKDGNEVIQRCMNNDVWEAREKTCVPKTDAVQCPEEST